MKREILAEKLYNEYCDAVGGVAFNGAPLPPWSEFAADPAKEKQADAWRAVATKAMEEGTPAPHELRVMVEKAALDEKLDKLTVFVAESPVFEALPQYEQSLLRTQLDCMRTYATLLVSRLECFSGD